MNLLNPGFSRLTRLRCTLYACCTAAALLAGCASPPRMASQNAGGAAAAAQSWSGRLALQIAQEPPKAFSASFQLSGSARQGTLDLYSPLGNTVAQIRWSPHAAVVQQGKHAHEYPDLDNLLAEVTGAPIPIAALFDWLAGRPTQAPGWQPDLDRHAEGRLTAQRLQPLPTVRLQVILAEPPAAPATPAPLAAAASATTAPAPL